jgi:hypothetical protein
VSIVGLAPANVIVLLLVVPRIVVLAFADVNVRLLNEIDSVASVNVALLLLLPMISRLLEFIVSEPPKFSCVLIADEPLELFFKTSGVVAEVEVTFALIVAANAAEPLPTLISGVELPRLI